MSITAPFLKGVVVEIFNHFRGDVMCKNNFIKFIELLEKIGFKNMISIDYFDDGNLYYYSKSIHSGTDRYRNIKIVFSESSDLSDILYKMAMAKHIFSADEIFEILKVCNQFLGVYGHERYL